MLHSTLVAKFGSSRLADAQGFRQILEWVQQTPGLRALVLSASADTQARLGALFEAAQAGNAAKVAGLYEKIYEHHTQLGQALGLSQADFAELNQCLAELLSRLTQIPRRLASPGRRDELLAFGERLACLLFSRQSRAKQLCWLDSTTLLATHQDHEEAQCQSAFVSASCQSQLLAVLAQGRVPVVQGAFGLAPDGTIRYLGADAGDHSAALLAESLQVDELRIWTDVPGVYSTDPHVVADAWPLPQLSFEVAEALTGAGGQVIDPRTIAPARRQGFPIWIGASLAPKAPGTWVGLRQDAPSSAVCAIASQSIARLWLGELDARAPEGVRDALLARMQRKGGRLLECSAERCLLAFGDRLRFSYEENRWLRQSGEWQELLNVRAVSLIGQELAGVLEALITPLCAELSVLAVSHVPGSGIARIFLNEPQASELLRRLHQALFAAPMHSLAA